MRQITEALILRTQSVANGNPDIIEEQFRCVLTFETDLGQQAAFSEARTVCFNADQGQLLGGRVELDGGDRQTAFPPLVMKVF